MTTTAPRERARPMAPDERRTAIIDAVLPLLVARGRDVSSRDLASAAGVAEGTLFRAFGDKEALFDAAVQRFADPEPFRDRMRGIDPDEPTEQKLEQLMAMFLERFHDVVSFTIAMRIPPATGDRASAPTWLAILQRMFRPGELAVPVSTLGHLLRLLAFGASVPGFRETHPFTAQELTGLLQHGVLPAPPPEGKPRA